MRPVTFTNNLSRRRLMVGAVVQLVEYRTRNQELASSTHTRSTASNLEQVANILCAQANSASYPQRDGKWVVATATGRPANIGELSCGSHSSLSMSLFLPLSSPHPPSTPALSLTHPSPFPDLFHCLSLSSPCPSLKSSKGAWGAL